MPDTATIAVEAELSVLGGILISADAWPPDAETLSPSDFVSSIRANAFGAMLALRSANEPVDSITVFGELKSSPAPPDGWAAYLAGLTSNVATAANLGHYARLVLRESRRRSYLGVMTDAIEQASIPGADADQIATAASARLGRIADGREIARAQAMREIVRAELADIDTRRATGAIIGHPTGFIDLDRMTCGLVPGHLVIVAGRPSMGKSSFARNILTRLAVEGGVGCLLLSFEMGAGEIGQAAIASESRVNLQRIRAANLSPEQYNKLIEAMATLHTDKLAVVDRPGMSIEEIRTVARAYSARHPLGVIAVDYLQLAQGKGQNREQEIASISRGLKAIAKELGVCVMGLSQLNRGLESREDKRPRLSDLRESGAIEQDADEVLFLYRDEYYRKQTEERGIAEVGIAKNRNGPTGLVKLRWLGEYTRFENLPTQQTP